MIKVKLNLSGKKFGKLTVLCQTEDYISPNGVHQAKWKCRCECGNECNVKGSSLKSGHTKSCGCFKNELTSRRSKKYNNYDLTNKYGIGYTSNTNEPFYFDLEDYDRIQYYCWHKNSEGYLISTNNNSHILIHRLIMNFPYNMVVDHINHNKLDNRKENLRICTHQQNMFNVSLRSNNLSGITGVCWDKKSNKWLAYITVNKKSINLGYYDNINEAIKIRQEAEIKYFKEYSPNKGEMYEI